MLKTSSILKQVTLVLFGIVIGVASVFFVGKFPLEEKVEPEKAFLERGLSKSDSRLIPVEGPFVLHRDGYSVCYDGARKNPLWVHEHLTPENFSEHVKRENKFKEDLELPKPARSTLADYKGSGYDRGHLAACANHCNTRESMLQSFLMSNMSPQVGPGFNRGAWKSLEGRVRKIAANNLSVHVISGPLYLPKDTANGREVHYSVIGKNDVAVPTHFFKVILVETKSNDFQNEAYILPNEKSANDRPTESYKVSIDQVQKLAGLMFR